VYSYNFNGEGSNAVAYTTFDTGSAMEYEIWVETGTWETLYKIPLSVTVYSGTSVAWADNDYSVNKPVTGDGYDAVTDVTFKIDMTAPITTTGAITGGSLTDGTATISSGAISGATSIDGTGDLTVGTITMSGTIDTTGTVDAGEFTEDGSTTLSNDISGSAADLNCSDCIGAAEIADGLGSGEIGDYYVFNSSDSMSGSLGVGTTLGVGGDLTVSGGDIYIYNNNGGILFNDASAYWLRTATNFGLFWNTLNDRLEFYGSGADRAYIDLNDGNMQLDGDLLLFGGEINSIAQTAISMSNDDVSVLGCLNVGSATECTTQGNIEISGNVGIGITDPTEKLYISDGNLFVCSGACPSFGFSGNGNLGVEGDLTVSGGRVTGSNSEYISIGETNNQINFVSNAATRARIDTSGNFGIEGSLYDISGSVLGINDNLDVNGWIQLYGYGATCNAADRGTMKYYSVCPAGTSTKHSYFQICMQTGDSTQAWQTIVHKSWSKSCPI